MNRISEYKDSFWNYKTEYLVDTDYYEKLIKKKVSEGISLNSIKKENKKTKTKNHKLKKKIIPFTEKSFVHSDSSKLELNPKITYHPPGTRITLIK